MNVTILQYISPSVSKGCYMPLGYYPKNTTRVVFDYLYYPIQGTGGTFSALLGATQPNYRFSSYNQGNCYILCYKNQQESPNGFTLDGAVEFGNFYLKLNGNTVYTTTPTGAFTSNVELTLGADKPSGGDELYDTNTKIGRFRIYEDNTLIAEFIPALDSNNVAGLYNATNDTFLYSSRSPWAAGPLASSISASASKKVLAASGDTINIEVSCDNAWEVSGNTWLTLSSTGDTGSTTITATAPSYSGVTARTDTLTFTDTVTGDEAEITIRQKKYTDGQPFYLGADEIAEIYLGVDTITEAYLGDVLVFSSNATAPSDPCEGMSEEECECASNGGTWIIPEIGDPYCEYSEEDPCNGDPECLCTQGGGTWTYNEGMDEYYCDCNANPECECISAGGEWDGTDCIYPEPEDPEY